ncbi:MAG: DUF1731 domain-containing protein [Fimbriimonadaceae bacterium]|nr:DUF1731 domain-containing protein [Fimbriimonadaceae bacterium]
MRKFAIAALLLSLVAPVALAQDKQTTPPVEKKVELTAEQKSSVLNDVQTTLFEKSFVPGIYNAVSPHPVTNREFMQTLSGLKFIPPVPAFVLVIIGKLIGPDSSLILNSCRVIPKALLDAGFEFQFSEIGVAFNDLLR